MRRGSCPVLPPDEREEKVGPARQARIGVSRLGKAGHGKAWHGLAGRGGAGYGRRGKARRVVAGPGKVRLGRRGEEEYMREDEHGNLILDDGTVIPERERQRSEVYSRCVGYLRPVEAWNNGKQAEFGDRKVFKVDEERGE